jgi:hypothetical protein
MFGLFGKSRFLEADVEDWSLETWAWLMTSFGGMERLRAAPIVIPNRTFFPPTETEGPERAAYLFDRVKVLMGMMDWPCELETYDRPTGAQRVGYYAMIQHGRSAHGAFRISDGRPWISYASDLVSQPKLLIATLAHELAHYLLATAKSHAPGGRELHELTTELTTAYVGFGVFRANTAFDFGQHQDAFGQGWSARRSGYFSERTWAFAIALFCALKDVAIPAEHLKGGVADLTKKAAHYLKRNERLLTPLRKIV